jgi:hypothetical protein
MEAETEFLGNLVDTMGYAIKQHGGAIFPAVSEAIGPYLMQFLPDRSEGNTALRAAAVCMCDDLIEFASPVAHSLLGVFVPQLVDAMGSSKPALQQPAVYGAGVCAEHAGPAFAQFIPEIMRKLGDVVRAPDSRVGDNENVSDNAVSSIIKMAKFRPEAVDRNALMSMALSYIPLKADGIEGRLVHGWMVDGLVAGEYCMTLRVQSL